MESIGTDSGVAIPSLWFLFPDWMMYYPRFTLLQLGQTYLKIFFVRYFRSFRWISSLDLMHNSKSTQTENRRFDDQYVFRILTTSVDIPTVLKQLPPVKKLHLNGAIHRSQVSTKDLYCLPDSTSLLTALGELYLLSKNVCFPYFVSFLIFKVWHLTIIASEVRFLFVCCAFEPDALYQVAPVHTAGKND